jgi:hypothetical protein
MRVQQRLTELAIKGDEALAGLREPAESPPWAVFDEDLPPQPSYLRPHAAEPEPAALESLEPQTPALAAVAAATAPAAAEAELEPYDLAADDTTTAEEQSWFEAIDAAYAQPPAAATEPPAEPATAATPAEPAAAATPAGEPTAAEPTAVDPLAGEPAAAVEPLAGEPAAAATPAAEAATTRAAGPASTETPNSAAPTGGHAEGPARLPNYGELSLASVRGRLRLLTVAELEDLLTYERSHDDRPEFVRLLTNRISAVRDL